MNKGLNMPLVKLVLVTVIIIHGYMMTWFVRHGELLLHTDVARDFLLLEELDQKKLVLIGPRSGTSGVFHGPLWSYLNYPVYVMRGGDPIVQSWFWMGLLCVFLGSSYVLVKKMISPVGALWYVLWLTGILIYHTSSLSHHHGSLFLMPWFLMSFYKYRDTGEWWWLVLNFLIGGAMIQFQLAIGIPFMLTSGLFAGYLIFRFKRWEQLIAYGVIPFTVLNFIVYDLKYDFKLVKAMLGYASPQTANGTYNYGSQFIDRISAAMDLQLSPGLTGPLAGFVFCLVLLETIKLIKVKDRFAGWLTMLSVFYFGYWMFTLINKGSVQHQQLYPVMALSFWWIAIVAIRTKLGLVRLSLVVAVMINLGFARSYLINQRNTFLGVNQGSWRFLQNLALEISNQETEEFGYFVYSPDVFAYTPRYAFSFLFKKYGVKATEWQKKPITYVIATPPAPDRPDLSYEWWRRDKLGIGVEPIWVISKPNGYRVEKFVLDEKEREKPWEHLVNVGIHFR